MNEQVACKLKSAGSKSQAAATFVKRKIEQTESAGALAAVDNALTTGLRQSLLPYDITSALVEGSDEKHSEEENIDSRSCVVSKDIEKVSHMSLESSSKAVRINALCQVCGDNSSGQHYGVHSCEGCKGFFRRTVEKAHSAEEARCLVQCKRGRLCSSLNPSLRNSCGPCRLIACYMAGMNRTSSKLGRRPKNRKEEAVIRPAVFVEDSCVQFVQQMYTIFREETRKSSVVFEEVNHTPTALTSQTESLSSIPQLYCQPNLLPEPSSQYSMSTSYFGKRVAALCNPAVLSTTDSIANHSPSWPNYCTTLSGTLSEHALSTALSPFDPAQLVYLAQQDNTLGCLTLLTLTERSQEPLSLVHSIVEELRNAQGSIILRKFAASRLHCAFIMYARNVLSACRSDARMFNNSQFGQFLQLAQHTRELLALPDSTLGLKTPKHLANQFQCRLLRQVNRAARLNLPFVELDVDLARLGSSVYRVIESYQNAQMWLLNPNRRTIIAEQLGAPCNRVSGDRVMHLFLNHLTQISMRAIRFFMWFGTANLNLATRMAMVQQGLMGIAALALVPLFDLERGLLYSPSLCYSVSIDELDNVPLFGPFLQCHARLARMFHAENITCEEWALLSAIYFTRPIVVQSAPTAQADSSQTVRLESLNAHFIKAFVFYALVRHTFGFWPQAIPSDESRTWSQLIRLWRLLSEQQKSDLKLEARNRFTRLTNPLNTFKELEELHKTLLGPIMNGAGSKLHSEIYSYMCACFNSEQQQQQQQQQEQ